MAFHQGCKCRCPQRVPGKPAQRAGTAFVTDNTGFFGTTASAAPSTATAIAGAAPSDYPLFQTAMQGQKMKAVLPLPGTPPGTPLLVVLYFCELYFKTAGSRSFSWAFNGGAAALPAPYDIVAAAGARYTAVQLTFSVRSSCLQAFSTCCALWRYRTYLECMCRPRLRPRKRWAAPSSPSHSPAASTKPSSAASACTRQRAPPQRQRRLRPPQARMTS